MGTVNLLQKTIRVFEQMGYSEQEARFYYYAYKNSNLSVSDLSKKMRISRATAYRIYSKFREQRIIVPSKTSHGQLNVISLQNIAQNVLKTGRKLIKLAHQCRNIDALLELSSFAFSEDPLEIITDKNLLVDQNYKILHKKWDHLLAYGSTERLLDVVGQEHERKFVNLRRRLGRTCDLFMTEFGDYAAYHMPNDLRDLRNTKFKADPNKQDYIMYMYDDEMTIWHNDKNLGVRALVVKDPLLLDMYKSMFHTSWSQPVSD